MEWAEERPSVELSLAVFDNNSQARLYQGHYDAVPLGDTVEIEGKKTNLGYDIQIHLGIPTEHESVYESLDTVINFGDFATVTFKDQDKSKYPYCDVGGWDWGSVINPEVPVS
jgi:hypothetical protein